MRKDLKFLWNIIFPCMILIFRINQHQSKGGMLNVPPLLLIMTEIFGKGGEGFLEFNRLGSDWGEEIEKWQKTGDF